MTESAILLQKAQDMRPVEGVHYGHGGGGEFLALAVLIVGCIVWALERLLLKYRRN